jgi:hypothetical protein
MIQNVLIFIGIALLIFPTWLYLQIFTLPSKSLIYRLFESLRIFWQSPNRQSKGGVLISFFQSWGLLWLLLGLIIGILGDRLPGSLLAGVVLLAMFIGPLFLLIVAKRQSNLKSNEKQGLEK